MLVIGYAIYSTLTGLNRNSITRLLELLGTSVIVVVLLLTAANLAIGVLPKSIASFVKKLPKLLIKNKKKSRQRK